MQCIAVNVSAHSYAVSLAIMGSHSVTWHPTQVNTPHLNHSHTGEAGTRFTYPGGMEG